MITIFVLGSYPPKFLKYQHKIQGGRGGGRGHPQHPLQYQWPLEGVGPGTHVHKITNLPVLHMVLGFNDFYEGKSITQAIGRGGPWNLDLFGPKWHSLCLLPFQGPKKSGFQRPLLPIALIMDTACIKIVTFGTFFFLSQLWILFFFCLFSQLIPIEI